MALVYAQLPDDPEELKQMVLKHSSVVEALRAEVLRLRRWRFGRSSEGIDTNIAPSCRWQVARARRRNRARMCPLRPVRPN